MNSIYSFRVCMYCSYKVILRVFLNFSDSFGYYLASAEFLEVSLLLTSVADLIPCWTLHFAVRCLTTSGTGNRWLCGGGLCNCLCCHPWHREGLWVTAPMSIVSSGRRVACCSFIVSLSLMSCVAFSRVSSVSIWSFWDNLASRIPTTIRSSTISSQSWPYPQ